MPEFWVASGTSVSLDLYFLHYRLFPMAYSPNHVWLHLIPFPTSTRLFKTRVTRLPIFPDRFRAVPYAY